MSARLVRGVVLVVCVLAIGGLVATSIADNTDAAIAFGLTGATAVIGLILVTAVGGREAFSEPGEIDPELASRVEHQIRTVVGQGAEEVAVRRLVGDAVRMGRRAGQSGSRR